MGRGVRTFAVAHRGKAQLAFCFSSALAFCKCGFQETEDSRQLILWKAMVVFSVYLLTG